MAKVNGREILLARKNSLEQKALENRAELNRLRNRISRIESIAEDAEQEARAIRENLVEHIEFNQLSVRLRIVEEFVQVRAKRLMLEIKIPGIAEPLFKMLSGYEAEILEKCGGINDRLVLDAKLKRMARDFIQVHQALPDTRGYELNSSTVLEEYIGHHFFISKIENVNNFINVARVE